MPRVAAFVSPHGFGHATRASAVMAALHERTGATFDLWAATPRWIFDESIEGLYAYHHLVTDVGLAQRSALAHDLDATVAALARSVPFADGLVDRLADDVRRAGCRAVLCDIAPLGIAVAERARLPSVLVENFLWPWIYEPLHETAPALERFSRELDRWFGRADVHVQTEPLCAPDPAAAARVPPIARPPRTAADRVRDACGIPPGAPLVVLTMGGVVEEVPFLDRLVHCAPVHFLVTGAPRSERRDNLRLFDQGTHIHMPDFVQAADAVVGKLGYSTVAEVWSIGRPFAFVTRERFREAEALRAWVGANLPGFEIPGATFAGGAWIDRIGELLATPRPAPGGAGGAHETARQLARAAGLSEGLRGP